MSQYLCLKNISTYMMLCFVTFTFGTVIAVYDKNPSWP